MVAEPQDIDADARKRLDDLNAVIDAYEATAIGSDTDGGELARQRTLALEAYVGKNIEPAPKGRSQVVDWTVFETIQWILPSLTRIFTTGDVVEFEPFGPEDEDAAEQESDFLNYLVTQKNNWFLTCLTWFQDALLTKNAYCMAFIDESLDTEVETYLGQSEEQVAMLLNDNVTVVGQQEVTSEDDLEPIQGPEGPVLDEFGQPVMQANRKFDIQLRKTEPRKCLKFKVLKPEHCKVDETADDFTLDGADYFEYWDWVSISDLRKMGFDVPDDIADDPETETREDAARDEVLQMDQHRERHIPDESVRQVKTRWIWVKHDFDDDGIAELQFVLRVGRFILEREDVSTIPVASIVPFLLTHRHSGLSAADLVFDIGRIKTHLLRSGLDNLTYSNNPKELFSNKVDLDALLLSRPGEKIPVDTDVGDVGGHVFPYQIPFVFPQTQEGLLHMDTVVESRVGVNRIFQGIDESNINDHNRIGQLSTMAAQRVEMIARIFGNGVERLFKIAHELVIKSGHQAETIKLRGEWVQFDPKQWRTGRDMRVVAPYSAGNKDSLLQRLMIHMNVHEKAIQAGHPMVQADDSYNLALDMAKASDVPGDRYYTDPEQVEPPPPEPDYTAAALEIEQSKVQTEAVDEARRDETERLKIVADADTKRDIAQIQSDTQIAIAQLKGGQQMEIEQVRGQNKNDLAKPVADLKRATESASKETKDALKASIEALEKAVKRLNAEKVIVRDDEGRVVGSKVKDD